MAEEKIINNEQRDAKEKKKELGEFYEKSFRELAEGEIVRGRVVEVGKEFVTIDVGYKSEGQVPVTEFHTRDGKLEVKRGDEVEVFLERREDQEGAVILSKTKADKTRIWDEIARACQQGDSMIEGTIVSRVRGGLTVDIGIPAFLPGSQIDLHPVQDLDQFIGQRLTFKVLKFNRKRGNIVLSPVR